LSASDITTPKAVAHLPGALHAGITDAFVRSLHTVFLVAVPIAAAVFVLMLFLKEIPLRSSSGVGGGEDQPVTAEQEELEPVESAV
jgi:hypothetical protein